MVSAGVNADSLLEALRLCPVSCSVSALKKSVNTAAKTGLSMGAPVERFSMLRVLLASLSSSVNRAPKVRDRRSVAYQVPSANTAQASELWLKRRATRLLTKAAPKASLVLAATKGPRPEVGEILKSSLKV